MHRIRVLEGQQDRPTGPDKSSRGLVQVPPKSAPSIDLYQVVTHLDPALAQVGDQTPWHDCFDYSTYIRTRVAPARRNLRAHGPTI